ncbi:hypothetical protein HC928_00445 [bacterium]|nr:hypothetical protein [bacterium]
MQSYGRDLRLKSEFVGTEELTDLAINQRGDLATIQGVPNVEQSLRLKFITERGELGAHPRFGAKFAIGSKATASSFNELRINTLNTITSDTRVNDVIDLQFVALGDSLAVLSKIQLKNSRDLLDISFALRRF